MSMDLDGRNRGGALSISSRANEDKIESEIAGDRATVLDALLSYSDEVCGANGTSVRMMLAWINPLRRSCPLVILSVRGAVSNTLPNSDVLMMLGLK